MVEPTIQEVQIFDPFIEYELDKEDQTERNMILILGIVSGKYRDQYSVWCHDEVNTLAIKDIFKEIKVKAGNLQELNIGQISQEYKKWRETELNEENRKKFYYRGRLSAFIMAQFKNDSFHILIEAIIKTYAFRIGEYDAEIAGA